MSGIPQLWVAEDMNITILSTAILLARLRDHSTAVCSLDPEQRFRDECQLLVSLEAHACPRATDGV